MNDILSINLLVNDKSVMTMRLFIMCWLLLLLLL